MKKWKKVLLFIGCLLPVVAHADEGGKEFLHISGAWDAEFNVLPTGNARVFSTRDNLSSTCTSCASKVLLGQEDRKDLAWRTGVQITADHPYFTIWVNPYTNWSGFDWPKSVGLRYTLLLKLANSRVKFGIAHHSAHNVVNEEYGRGTSCTGAHLVWTVLDESGWQWRVWTTYNFHDANESPYIFTPQAQDVFQKELRNLRWQTGSEMWIKEDRVEVRLPIELRATKVNVQSIVAMTARSVMLYRLQKGVRAGPFFEYDRNFSETGTFGRDEWLLGAAARVDF